MLYKVCETVNDVNTIDSIVLFYLDDEFLADSIVEYLGRDSHYFQRVDDIFSESRFKNILGLC